MNFLRIVCSKMLFNSFCYRKTDRPTDISNRLLYLLGIVKDFLVIYYKIIYTFWLLKTLKEFIYQAERCVEDTIKNTCIYSSQDP